MLIAKKNKIVFIGVFLFYLVSLQAQNKPAVYKIDKLLKRIHNTSDTVYVVNFWATWCKPCVQELPDFNALHLENIDKKIKVLLVSLDFKEDLSKKLIPFITKNDIQAECVLLDEVNGNNFIDKINKQWGGAIPATYITYRNKQQEVFFEKKLSKEELHKAIQAFNTSH